MRLFERFNAQAVFAVGLILFATVYASQIPKLGMPFTRPAEPGASFFPLVLVTILYVAAFRVLLAELRRAADAPQDAAPVSDTVPRIGLLGPLVLVLLTAVFATALPTLGYFAAAAIYTFGVALFFNFEETGRLGPTLARSALTSAAITGFGWLFFEGIFGLSLPGWGF
jgi:putative tricarboxylic transport membrane protein